MRSPIVVKADPVADHAAGVLQCLEAMSVHALVFEGSYHAFHQAVISSQQLLLVLTLKQFISKSHIPSIRGAARDSY